MGVSTAEVQRRKGTSEKSAWDHLDVTVVREATITKFSKKYPAARKPLQRFLAIARAAVWPHFPAVKQSFPAADYAATTGTLIFDIGGNKYRLIARVDFEEQVLAIQEILTHEQYDRKNI